MIKVVPFFTFILMLVLVFTNVAQARDSFRLANGKLLKLGKSKSEILLLAGAPIYQDVEQIAVDNGQGGKPVKRDIFTYQLRGSIGGNYLVVVTFENNKVVSISSQQQNR